jgi:hypothetical protein
MGPNAARNRFNLNLVVVVLIALSLVFPSPARNALAGASETAQAASGPITVLEAQSPAAPLWTGTGHFVLESIGYTDGIQPRAYTIAPNFRQASSSLAAATSSIPGYAAAADLYVNFDFDTTGKSVFLVYTTNGTAPSKTNGTVVNATFSRYLNPNRTWYTSTAIMAPGTVVNYVFYMSDSTLASANKRVSGTTADRNVSQYQTSWTEGDAYFSYTASSATSNLVIGQLYGGGGLTGAPYKNDYVEIFNRGSVAVPLSGLSIQYASDTGSSWTVVNLNSYALLQPGQFFLVQLGSDGAVGSSLPTPDATAGTNMSGTKGKVALVSTTTALSGSCPTGPTILDFVGYGSTASCQEGATKAPAPSTTTADFRAGSGCTDTDVNGSDFSTGSPAPRNSSSPLNVCAVATPTPTATTVPTATPTNTPTPTSTSTNTNTPTPVPVCGGPVSILDGSATAATRDGIIGVSEYAGSSCGINAGFANVIGSGSKLYLDSDGSQNLFLGLQTGGGAFNDFVVVYIDSVTGGFGDTTAFNDDADNHRAAISARGRPEAGRSDITFSSGFQAERAR